MADFAWLQCNKDRGAVIVAFLGFAAMLLPFGLSVLVDDLPTWTYWVYWPFFWLLISRNNYILHNHCHHPMARKKWLNRLLDYALGAVTGMSAGAWRITHNHGHHVTHKRDALPNRWLPFVEAKEPLLRKYSLTHALWFSLKTTPIQWVGILWEMGKQWSKKGFRSNYYRYHFCEAVAIWVLVFVLGWVDIWLCLGFVVLPHFLAQFFSRYIDYMFHVCADPDDAFKFCFSCVNYWYNYFCWNAGYHLAHHHQPRLHWSQLKEHHEELAREHPEVGRLVRRYNYSGAFALIHPLWEKLSPRKPLLSSP